MPEFAFEALAPSGERSRGTLTANTERETLAMLEAKGLYPVRVQPVQTRRSLSFLGGRVSGRHMATFYSQLADLLHSGVPLLRALDILDKMSAQATLQIAIRELRARVADGTGLAQAMAQHPKIFNELAVSMVRAGQEGGFLEDVLRRVADFTEHQEDLKAKVIGALAYPVFLLTVMFVVLTLLVVFVIPMFEPIFARQREKNQLPTITTYLLGGSHFLQSNWWWLIPGVIVMIVGYVMWSRTPSGRFIVDRIRLRIPAAGKIFLNLALSRFTRILGTLLHNGIPILRSLEIAKDSTGNKVLTAAIEQSAENVTAGQKLATPLGACPYFPRDVVEMVAIAEESNNLEKVLIEISNSLEKRTSRQLELFVRLLEPAMLLVMAVIVLFVILGLMLPIFNMGNVMRG
jgi:general secretion pathway protein F/type IV pilus assembly protein PilC